MAKRLSLRPIDEDTQDQEIIMEPDPEPKKLTLRPLDEPVKKKDESDSVVSKDYPGLSGLQQKLSGKNIASATPLTAEERQQQLQGEESVRLLNTKERDAPDTEDPVTALIQTVKSGISDQIPKEYYAQRLRMSKGSFGDLFDPRSDLNAFGDKLPKGISREDFYQWSNSQPDQVRMQDYDKRAKLFITQRLGHDGYEKLKQQFAVENVEERVGFEKEIQQQNIEAQDKMKGVVQNLKDVHGAMDFLNFAGGMIGQSLYRAPISIVTGPTGSIMAESAAVYDRQLDLIAEKNGISREEVIRRGLDDPAAGQALAVMAGTLDAASSLNMIGLFRKAIKKELVDGTVKQFAKGFAKGGIPEMGTEVLQGEMEELGASKGAGVKYNADAWRIASTAVGSLVGGGTVGAITSINNREIPLSSIPVKNAPQVVREANETILTPAQTVQPTDNLITEQAAKLDTNSPESIEKAAETVQAKIDQDTGSHDFSKVADKLTKENDVTPEPGGEPKPGGTGAEVGGLGPSESGVQGQEVTKEEKIAPENQEPIQKVETKTGEESGKIEFKTPEKTAPQPTPESPGVLAADTAPGTTELVKPTSQTALGARIEQSETIQQPIKEAVKGKDQYIPRQVIKTNEEAKKILADWNDTEFAERAIRDKTNEMEGGTRGALAANLFEQYRDEADKSTDESQKTALYNKAADIAVWAAQNLTKAGQETAIAGKIWKAIASSEDLLVMAMEKQNAQQARKFTAPIKDKVQMSRQQFDEQVRRLVESKVQETVEGRLKRAKLITADQKKKISDTFDSLKIKGVEGTANDVIRVIGATVWNGSVEVVKRAILTGADAANAIQAGVDYIKANYKYTNGDFSEQEYRDLVNPHAERMVVQDKIERSEINDESVDTPKLSGKRKKEFLDQVVEAHNAGELTDDKFEELYAQQLGAKKFSPEERTIIREAAKVISEAEKFKEVVKNDFTVENISKYQGLLDKAKLVNKSLEEYANRNPSDVWSTLSSIMQGNLLAKISLVKNVYSNAILVPLRFMSTVAATIPDQAVSGLAKMGLLADSYKDPTINLVALQRGFFQGGWNGLIEGLYQMKTGQLAEDRNLRDINTQFDPIAAIKRWGDGNRTAAQKINDAIEGTLGVPAELVFRLLNLGDKPFRRAAELARAFELGATKGISGKELLKFVMFPDDISAQEIDQHGKEATFQNESGLAVVMEAVTNTLINGATINGKKIPGIGDIPLVGGVAKLLIKSQIPFVRTPSNILAETFNYALPPITFAHGIVQMARGNKRAGSMLIGKAMVGYMIWQGAQWLLDAGLMTPDYNDKEDDNKAKERKSLAYDTAQPNSINMSAIIRGDFTTKSQDIWVDYRNTGILGMLMGNYSNSYYHAVKAGEEPFSDMLSEMSIGGLKTASSALDQSFLQGTNTFLEALKDPEGYAGQKWVINTTEALTSILVPRTITTIGSASDDFIRDTRDDKLWGAMKNTFRSKYFMGDRLAAKVNLWGEKITGNPEGRNRMTYYLFDPTKFKEVSTDSYQWKVFSAWKANKYNDEWLPSLPKRTISINGVDVKLNNQEYEKLCIYIGKDRSYWTALYTKSAKNITLEDLKEQYKEGYQSGREKFLMATGLELLTKEALEKHNRE